MANFLPRVNFYLLKNRPFPEGDATTAIVTERDAILCDNVMNKRATDDGTFPGRPRRSASDPMAAVIDELGRNDC